MLIIYNYVMFVYVDFIGSKGKLCLVVLILLLYFLMLWIWCWNLRIGVFFYKFLIKIGFVLKKNYLGYDMKKYK